MSALAGRDFVKMNGLGNEIVIVDLRRAPNLSTQSPGTQSPGAQGPIAAAEARAAARQEPYDQLMALYPGDVGTDARVRIYNNDGSEAGACGNGMRCVAALVSGQTGKATLRFETPAGLIACWRADRRIVHGRYGPSAFSLGRDSAGARDARYPGHRA